MKKAYEKHNCDMLNEAECDEELKETEGMTLEDAEEEYFED